MVLTLSKTAGMLDTSGWRQLMESDTLQFVLGQPTDAAVVCALLEEAGQWLERRGIDQWPSQLPPQLRADVADRIAWRETYLVMLAGQPVGSLTLQWSDFAVWGEQPPDAGYVHGLVVRRSVSGQGIGQRMLEWAAGQVVYAGRHFLRLDYQADNAALCAYYTRAGFRPCGRFEQGRWSAQLFEKRVSQVRI